MRACVHSCPFSDRASVPSWCRRDRAAVDMAFSVRGPSLKPPRRSNLLMCGSHPSSAEARPISQTRAIQFGVSAPLTSNVRRANSGRREHVLPKGQSKFLLKLGLYAFKHVLVIPYNRQPKFTLFSPLFPKTLAFIGYFRIEFFGCRLSKLPFGSSLNLASLIFISSKAHRLAADVLFRHPSKGSVIRQLWACLLIE
jgi:hypothetical protein